LDNIEELVEHKGYTFSDYIRFGYKTELSQEELENFRLYGGAPWLYGHTVVLGQAIEGMEVLDEIEKHHTEEPETEVIIDSIETD
jgi:cyclophilin family peptidyl-prolyl cis-trans isomerase